MGMTFTAIQEAVLSELSDNAEYTELLRDADTLRLDAVERLAQTIYTMVRKRLGNQENLVLDIAKRIYLNNYGLGAISDLYYDGTVSEIWVNSWDNIWAERAGKREKCEGVRFGGESAVRRVIDLMLRYGKKEISVTTPSMEARLSDGSRITAFIPPVSDTPGFVLRCPNTFTPKTETLLNNGTMDRSVAELLTVLVRGRANIVVIGETGAGKTQLIRWLLGQVMRDIHIVTLETVQELNLHALYPWMSVQSLEECHELGIQLSDLFRTTLRMTPTIIVCGEMRSYEAAWVINAMRRGHPGSMSSLHCTAPELVVNDVTEMIGSTGDGERVSALVANAIDIVIQINRCDDGQRRIMRVSEITRGSGGTHGINDLMRYNHDSGTFERTGQIRGDVLQKTILRYAMSGKFPLTHEQLTPHFYSF